MSNENGQSSAPSASRCSTAMTDQEVFELGQLYAELFLIRSLINGGDGIRQRLLPQNDCEALDGVAKTTDTVIRKLMIRIDEHKQARR